MASSTFVSQSYVCFLLLVATLLLNATFMSDKAAAEAALEARNNKALVDYICKQAESYEFCSSILKGDLRTASADLHGLALISIALSIDQVRDTLDQQIPHVNMIGQASVIDKHRMEACKSDYGEALVKFQGAFWACDRRSYWEVIDWVRYGANKAIDCEDIYRRCDPISVSPISGDNHKLIWLAEITFIVLDSLLRSTP